MSHTLRKLLIDLSFNCQNYFWADVITADILAKIENNKSFILRICNLISFETILKDLFNLH